MSLITLEDYKNSNIAKSFVRNETEPKLVFEALEKSLIDKFRKGSISEEFLEKSLDELDLMKGLESRDKTHGGKLIPKNIIDNRGFRRLVYVLPEEVTEKHTDLVVGDKYQTRYKGADTLVRDKGHDGKGHLVTLRDDSGRVHDKYLHNIEHISSQVEKPNNFLNYTKSGKIVNEGENPLKQADKFKEWNSTDHEDAAVIHQNLADAAKKVANWHWRNGEKEEAKKNYKLFDHHNEIGNAHRKLAEESVQKLPKGVLELTKSGKSIPENPDYGLAFSLRKNGQWDEQDFQDALQTYSKEASKEEKIAKKLFATGDRVTSSIHYNLKNKLNKIADEFQTVVNGWDHNQVLEGILGTVNGKTLHANPDNPEHDSFTLGDHNKASSLHKEEAEKIKDENGGYLNLNPEQRKKRAAHYRAADRHQLLGATIDDRQRKKKQQEDMLTIERLKKVEQEKQDFKNSPEGKRIERLKNTPGTIEYRQEQKRLEAQKKLSQKFDEGAANYYSSNIAQGRRVD